MTRDHKSNSQSAQQRSSAKQAAISQQSASSHSHHHYPQKVVQFETFSLFSRDDESIKRAIERVEKAALNRYRICVVSVISKEALDESTKSSLIQSILSNTGGAGGNKRSTKAGSKTQWSAADEGSTIQENGIDEQEAHHSSESESATNFDYENQVDGHVDTKSGIIVLNMTSFIETDRLSLLCQTNVGPKPNVGFERNDELAPAMPVILEMWPTWNQNLTKTMLILFIMSHIVVIYNPEPTLDYNLVQTFKILELLRLKSQTRVTDLLETIASKQMFPQQWIRQGRVSCPRALFVCDTVHLDVPLSQSDIIGLKLEVEDQIYKVLKKSNVIVRPTSSSHMQQQALFSIPERDDFVFILKRQQDSKTVQEISNPRKSLGEFYSRLFSSLDLEEKQFEAHSPASTNNDDSGANQTDHHQTSRKSINTAKIKPSHLAQQKFRNCITKQIHDIQALAQVDHDNKHQSGRQSGNSPFLPRYDDFFSVLIKLKNLFFPQLDDAAASASASVCINKPNSDLTQWRAPDERRFVDIYDLVSPDQQFSKHHCFKVRLSAFDTFKRVLQIPGTSMTQTSYETALEEAKYLYISHARGPEYQVNYGLLVQQCIQHWLPLADQLKAVQWKDDRQLRNNRVPITKSGNTAVPACIDKSSHKQIKSGLSILRRANGIKMTACCDCGRQSNYMITPVDRKKKLERVDIHRTND